MDGLLRRALPGTAASPSSMFANSGVRTRHAVANPVRRGRLPLGHRGADGALPGRGAAAGQGRGRRRARPTPGSPPATSGCSPSARAPGTPPPAWTSGWPATSACRRVQRLFVGHMGCYAALPGLGAVADFVVARGRPAVLLCLELTSLHVQPPTDRHRPGGGARAVRRRGGRGRAGAGRRGPGSRCVDVVAADRRVHGRPHDLGRHRPRLPDGAVAAGARRCWPGTSPAWSTSCWARTGWHRRRRRLGGAPGRAADPRGRASAELGLAAGRAWRLSYGVLADARQLLVGDRAAGAGADARGRGRWRRAGTRVALAFGPG